MRAEVPIQRINLRDFPPVPPLIDPPEKWSQTALDRMQLCPRSAYLYWKYYGGAATHPMLLGTLMHRAFEAGIWIMVENEENELPYEGMGKDLIEETIRRSTDLTIPVGDQDRAREMMYHFCEGFVVDPKSVAGVEAMLELDVPLKDGTIVTVRGKADLILIDGPFAQLIDWKTSWIPDNEQEFMKAFQNRFYAVCLAFGRVEGHPPGLGRFIQQFACSERYPRHLWTDGMGEIGPVIYDRVELQDELIAITSLCEKLHEATKGQPARIALPPPSQIGAPPEPVVLPEIVGWDMPPVHGTHCTTCAASHECPIPPALRKGYGTVRSFEDAAKLATRRDFDKKRAEDDWEIVKFFCNDNGPLRYGRNLILEFQPVEGRRMKKGVSVETIQEAIDKMWQTGEVVQLADYYDSTKSMRLKRRKLTEAELREEAGLGGRGIDPASTPSEGEEVEIQQSSPAEFDPDARRAEQDQRWGVEAPF